MPTTITVTPMFQVTALLDINSAEFAHQYELGTWWAMYGDEQGKGPYPDSYLIENIGRNLRAGHYNDISSPWFSSVGFYLGIVHGGMLDSKTRQLRSSASLVILADPDFAKGYHAGRRYYFFEAPPDEQRMTDAFLVEAINGWALEYPRWNEPEACLRYLLGCRVGALSGELLPMDGQERAQIETEDRKFMAEYQASRAMQLLLPTRTRLGMMLMNVS